LISAAMMGDSLSLDDRTIGTEELAMKGQFFKPCRSVVLAIFLCTVVLSVRPAMIGFHRLMVKGLHAAHSKLYGTPIPESALHRLLYQAQWHQRRLVNLGRLERRVHKFRFLGGHSPAWSVLASDLAKAMGRDCNYVLGPNQIEVVAPPQTIGRLMAVIEAHDVAAVGPSSSATSSE
jgi:hypothetical protein